MILRTRFALACLALTGGAMICTSCNENIPPPQQDTRVEARQKFFNDLAKAKATYSDSRAQLTPGGPAGAAGQPIGGGGMNLALPAAAETAAPIPAEPPVAVPANAEWSLACISLSTPDRFARMSQMKAYLSSKSPFKNWYVIHDETKSTLFYGFYASISHTDPKGAQAQADRKALSEWVDPGTKERPFTQAMFTRLAEPEPIAPAEWKLSNAPATAYWSIQVAAFQGNGRKETAVEAVKEMRGKHIDAFYHHGQTISSVCIGAWPANAVKQQDDDHGRSVSPEDQVLVSDTPLPAKYKNARMQAADGTRIKAVAQRIEIADETLDAALKQYPYHLTNSRVIEREVKTTDGKKVMVPDPSFLVMIPRNDAAGLAAQGWGNSGGGQAAGNTTIQPTRDVPTATPGRGATGSGRLRGYGEN